MLSFRGFLNEIHQIAALAWWRLCENNFRGWVFYP